MVVEVREAELPTNALVGGKYASILSSGSELVFVVLLAVTLCPEPADAAGPQQMYLALPESLCVVGPSPASLDHFTPEHPMIKCIY